MGDLGAKESKKIQSLMGSWERPEKHGCVVFVQRKPLTSLHQRRSIQEGSDTLLVGMVSPTRSCTIVTTTKRNSKNKNNWLLGVLDKAVGPPKNGHGTQLVMIYFRFLLP